MASYRKKGKTMLVRNGASVEHKLENEKGKCRNEKVDFLELAAMMMLELLDK